MAVTDGTGAIVETYDYGDYGEPSIYSAEGNTCALSAIGNTVLFTGRRYDEESGFYYYRSRQYDPIHGRFISRDPLGIWGDPLNLGNAFTYVGNNPWSRIDPYGLCNGGLNPAWSQLDNPVESSLAYDLAAGALTIPRLTDDLLDYAGAGIYNWWRGEGAQINMDTGLGQGAYYDNIGLGGGNLDSNSVFFGQAWGETLSAGIAGGRETLVFAGWTALTLYQAMKGGGGAGGAGVERRAVDILPGTLKRKFPGEYLGNTLSEVKELLRNAKGKEKSRLKTAKKLLEQSSRLAEKLRGKK